MPFSNLAHDSLIADHAAFLQRWFALGAAMSPEALRAHVEALEAAASSTDGSDELEPGRRGSGLVLYLPGHDPKTSEDDGAR